MSRSSMSTCTNISSSASLQSLLFSFLLLFILHSPSSSSSSTIYFKPSLIAATAATTYSAHSSQLDLSHGLNLSVIQSYNFSRGVPTFDARGIFIPVLSSPLFNRTNPSQDNNNKGFSLGFYFLPVYRPGGSFGKFVPCSFSGCDVYMAVCAGSSGSSNSEREVDPISLDGAIDANDSSISITAFRSVDGFVVPVWFANMGRPIKYASSASLIAESREGSGNMELQLRDGEEVLWKVSNVGMMELQDTGELLIYNSTSSTSSEVVWRSSKSNYITDTLVSGQILTEGMELRSNDSSYVARVEKGGLVLYLNNVSFNMDPHPPYWIFPLPRTALLTAPMSKLYYFNQIIYSAPCTHSSANLSLNSTTSSLLLADSRSCAAGSTSFSYERPNYIATDAPNWVFLRLENDGRLYIYVVANPVNTSASATRSALDSPTTDILEEYSTADYGSYHSWGLSQEYWGHSCDVPMACGPFGVCTPYDAPTCSCPSDLSNSFEQVNSTNIFQGCKPRIPLPRCTTGGDQHLNTIDFLKLPSTASIFLFSRWTFNYTKGSVDACRNFCHSRCSCKGFIYQANASACLFITDGISLYRLGDHRTDLSLFDYSIDQEVVLASNYVTYLKVVSTPNASSSAATASNKDAIPMTILIKAVIPSMAVACLVLGLAGYFLAAWRRKRAQMILRAREEEELRDILPLLPSRFSYKDMHEATRGFSELLGAGGCGCVYAGVLFDGRKVAVKVLKVLLQGAGEQSKQFLAEVASVGRTNHQNIVRLVGFCWEVSQRLLVYEYVEKGALDKWLFQGDHQQEEAVWLDWQARYNVALGMARGINYLHEECEPPILHFDIKPENVLLDEAFVAKLADFGMSRLMQRDISSVVTGVRGTPGYIAPEWFSHGSVSKKSDVYSMGMVLLELVAGRRILECSLLSGKSSDKEAFHLPTWAAKKCEQGLIMELIDKRLRLTSFDCEQAQRLLHIAFCCIHEDPVVRPNAPTVVSWLERNSHLQVPLSSFALDDGGVGD